MSTQIPDAIEQAKAQLSNYADRPFRPYQREAVEFIRNSSKRFQILEIPTGGGKSLAGMTCGILAGGANYLCSTKLLQSQLVSDFPEARSLWGRANYPCTKDASRNCDECSVTEDDPCDKGCPYKNAKEALIGSKLRILNYSYYLVETQFVGRLRGAKFSIVDEADALENTLVNHICLSFTERALNKLGLEEGPSRKTASSKTGVASWKDFGNAALMNCRDIIHDLDKIISEWGKIEEDWQYATLKEHEYYVHLAERCETFIENVDETWIMEEQEGTRGGTTTVFRPIWITPELAEEFMWKYSDRWMLMSASFPPIPVVCKQLGIDPDDVDYYQAPSMFPIERRPINIWPVANLTSKTMDVEVPKLIKGIKKILDMHPDEKGLIHSVSFKLGKQILEGAKSKRLLIHNSHDRQEVVDRFTGRDDNSVLISPSLERGVSLENDLCRFVIVAKAPFLSLLDKVVSSRVYGSAIGKLWYSSLMMQTVLQMCGRGMRHSSDFCVSYILDAQVNRVYTSKPSLWPEWFSEAIGWSDNLLLDQVADEIDW